MMISNNSNGVCSRDSQDDFYHSEASVNATENKGILRRSISKSTLKSNETEERLFTKEQTKEVHHMKVAIAAVLLCSILGAVVIFARSKISAEEQFQLQFSGDADKVHFSLILCLFL